MLYHCVPHRGIVVFIQFAATKQTSSDELRMVENLNKHGAIRRNSVSSLKEETIAIATTTWNSGDTIAQFLDHHLEGDIDRIFVMDFGSNDDTLNILEHYCSQGTVELLKLPSLKNKDSSNLLLNHIHSSIETFTWCLFIDPDEFLSQPNTLASALSTVSGEITTVNLQRFNVTGVRPSDIKYASLPFKDLDLKIKHRCKRSAEDRRALELNPPWIFTDIPGKVAVRVESEVVIGDGDHSTRGGIELSLEKLHLLHFPIRSWEKFLEKVNLAKVDFQSNPHLGPDFGWHLRRWITIHENGALAAEFLGQFIDKDDVEHFVKSGVLERIT